MGESHTTHRIKLGEKFSSFQEVWEAKKQLEKLTNQVFTTNGNQRRLDSKLCKALNPKPNDECVYHYVTLSCKYGPKKEQSQATKRDAK